MGKKAPTADLLTLYRMLLTIRAVETSLTRLFADGEVPGFIHLSIGQEAVAAGVCSALGEQDTLATTHRGHGHVLARGLSLDHFFREVMGRAGGVCAGRGGSMHVADMDMGILGANGIVGAGIPIALGSALAHQIRRTGAVAIVFFGDGAMAEGVLHETLNMAALWRLPLLMVCENNGWSEFSPTSKQFVASLEKLADAFGIGYCRVDGNDVRAVAQAASDCIATLRQAGGPLIIECSTQRVRGHYEGDPQKYRPADELAAMEDNDPIKRTEQQLATMKVSAVKLKKIRHEVDLEIMRAIDSARSNPEPMYSEALADVYANTQTAR